MISLRLTTLALTSVIGLALSSSEAVAQSGNAPSDARDPHAYSDGNTLSSGAYSLFEKRQLILADEHRFAVLRAERLEYQQDEDATAFDLQGRYGTSYSGILFKTEGSVAEGELEHSQNDLVWDRAISPYFDMQIGAGLSQYAHGKNRQWLAFGVQGIAPYWFEIDATAYLGANGRSKFAFEAEYEILLSQKLILQPRLELNLYGKQDIDNGLGSGLSDLSLGLRLRYEITRQFAPYIGITREHSYGDTARYAQAQGQNKSDTELVAGLRFWF